MIDANPSMSIRRQCVLLSVSRNRRYRTPSQVSEEDLRIMRRLDTLYLEDPAAGARRLAAYLKREGFGRIGRRRVRRLMKQMAIEAVYPRPRTTTASGKAARYPYLLRNVAIDRPNQVWCADITYIPMRRGFMYLAAILDWHSRKALAWELSNTLDTEFCLRTLRQAFAQTGVAPEIMNTDQGCQFTSDEWIDLLKARGVSISMDGRGAWRDNVIIERFWRSVKYEDVYLKCYEDGRQLARGLERYMQRYNERRPHQALGGATPEEIHAGRVCSGATGKAA
jgi:putative transposase